MDNTKNFIAEDRPLKAAPGMPMLILLILLYLGATALTVAAGIATEGIMGHRQPILCTAVLIFGILYLCIGWLPFMGLKVLKPKEALVLTLFGKYVGVLTGPGFFFVNPFCQGVNPAADAAKLAMAAAKGKSDSSEGKSLRLTPGMDSSAGKKISLKAITLNNGKQKINDRLGNPIEIGIVVIWQVASATKAVFNVDNYMEYLSIQADSALRNIVRLYPYDLADDGEECTLRGSSQEVSLKLKEAIQEKVEIAGLEVLEARITHLAYAPEIAAAMLQRQQASAIIDARKMIVDGAVGMVEMALDKLSENNVVELDEERKAAMVSNLLVVLCGNRDAQPIVNSGSLY